jgi:hypothetical protein
MTKTPYTQGFQAGIRYQRDNILDYIKVHHDQNVAITVEDIFDEINSQDKADMNAQLQEMRELYFQDFCQVWDSLVLQNLLWVLFLVFKMMFDLKLLKMVG